MRRDLLIMRHAKSLHSEPDVDDFDRSLAPRGRKDVARICEKLRDHGLIPDHIFSSPAKRAKQTAQLVCVHLSLPEDRLSFIPELYAARPEELLAFITSIPDDIHMPMIVGHNPELDECLEYLCGTNLPLTDNGKLMTTASIAHVNIPTDRQNIQRHCIGLEQLLRPKD
jgi:phosphohistidine phosphatase